MRESTMKRMLLWINVVGAMLLASVAFGQERATGYKRPTEAQRTAAYKRDQARNGARVAVAAKAMMAALPTEFDCVKLGWVCAIEDQGNCGSCYGVATADQLQNAFTKAFMQKNDGSFAIRFQFGLDCQNFGGCGGGWGFEVAEYMRDHGFPAEYYVDANGKKVVDYPPYEARSRTCRTAAGAKMWKPSEIGFCAGSSNRAATIAEIKTCLMTYGLVNIAFNANSAYGNAGPNSIVRVTGGANHETTCVGWDDTKNGGKGALKTRGNWGKGLGDGGYVWFTYDSQLEDPFWMSVPPLPPPPPPDPDPPPGNLTITPANVTLGLGGTQQFQITPAGSYVWSASAGTVTSTGMYTAPQANGSYTVSANVPGDPTKYAIAKVTVGAPPIPGVTIIVNKDLPAGTYQLTPVKQTEVETKEPPIEKPMPPPENSGLKEISAQLVTISMRLNVLDKMEDRIAALEKGHAPPVNDQEQLRERLRKEADEYDRQLKENARPQQKTWYDPTAKTNYQEIEYQRNPILPRARRVTMPLLPSRGSR